MEDCGAQLYKEKKKRKKIEFEPNYQSRSTYGGGNKVVQRFALQYKPSSFPCFKNFSLFR